MPGGLPGDRAVGPVPLSSGFSGPCRIGRQVALNRGTQLNQPSGIELLVGKPKKYLDIFLCF